MKKELHKISETAILVALAVALDLIGKVIPFLNMPQGGHVSLAMLPLLVMGFRNGYKYGFLGGIIYAIINFMLDGFVLHWGSIFFDYLFAFGIFGIAGFFSEKGKKLSVFLIVSFALCFLRYLLHGFSGVLFFAQYAEALPASWNLTGHIAVWAYSFIFYNLPYMAFSTVGCLVIGAILHDRKIIYYNINENQEF